jgi:hypothetical protein
VSAHAPWCTLERAARAGRGTVLVRGGPYPRLRFTGRTKPIAFRAMPGGRPTVDGMAISYSRQFSFSGFRFTGEVDLTRVSHCSFAGNLSQLTPNGTQTPSGYVVAGVAHASWTRNEVTDGWIALHFRYYEVKRVRIAYNRFTRLGGQGIHLQQGDHVLISHNAFTDIVPREDIDPGAHADAVQSLGPSRSVKLDANSVIGGRGFLIQFSPEDYGKRAGQRRMVVQNNLFTGRDFGIRVFSAPGIRIVSNTVWGTETGPGTGIDLESRVGANLQTTRALLRDNLAKRLDVRSGTTYRSDHNLIAKGPRRGSHNLSGTPLFVAPGTDWRLLPGSPGRGTATRQGVPRRDRRGRLRPSAPDVGSEQS